MANCKPQRTDASVALITVIVVSSILLTIGVSLVLSSMDLSTSSKNTVASSHSYSLRRTCLEEALYRLKYDSSYSIGINVTTEYGECTATITTHETNPSLRYIDISTQYEEYTSETRKTVDISQNPIELKD